MLYFLVLLYTVMLLLRPQEFIVELQRLPLLQMIILVALPVAALTGNRGVTAEAQQRSVPLLVAGAVVFGIVVIYTLIGLSTPPSEAELQIQRAPLQVTLFSALACWLLLPHKGWEMPQLKLAGPFLLIAAVGMGLNGWWGGGVFLLQKVLPALLTALLLSGAIRSLRQLHGYLALVIGIACVIVLHGHLQLANGVGWTGSLPIKGRITYSGIFDDPNDLGLLLVIAIASVCYLFSRTNAKSLRALLLATLGWLLYGVLLTDSRGTILAVLAVFMIHLWKTLGRKTLIVVGLLTMVLVLLGSRLADIDPEEESAAGRIDAWIEGIGMLRQNPLFGVGYGNFTDYNPLTAHNTFVLAFAELGLLGYIAWLAMVGYSGYMLFWLTYRATDWATANNRELPADFAAEIGAARGLLVAALGFAVGAFFLSQSFKPLLYLVCGLAMGRWLGVAQRIGPLPQLSFLRHLGYWLGASIGSIVAIYAIVKTAS